jgi:hypothetical protein
MKLAFLVLFATAPLLAACDPPSDFVAGTLPKCESTAARLTVVQALQGVRLPFVAGNPSIAPSYDEVELTQQGIPAKAIRPDRTEEIVGYNCPAAVKTKYGRQRLLFSVLWDNPEHTEFKVMANFSQF